MAVDVLVCNLTRFGDLLQSQAVIDDLHCSGHRVGLVCIENFASALPLLRNVDESWKLPGGKLLAQINSNWVLATSSIMDFATSVREKAAPRHILNLTPSLPARLLAKMFAANGAGLLGFGMDEFGYGLNSGVWSSFLAVAAGRRINSPFNIADLFRKLALPLTGGFRGVSRLAEPDQSARDWASAFIGEKVCNARPKGFVSFQLGASAENRRWPVKNFCGLGHDLWHMGGYMPVLLGTVSEAIFAEEYAAGADHPFINATGKTDLMQLAALLKETELLVTNDTGTMHLAAGLGIPSLSFFLATAQPFDTGPLLPDCCCLEPEISCHPCSYSQVCHKQGGCRGIIGSATAASLALAWLETRDWRNGITEGVRKEARVWSAATDDAGMAIVSSLDGKKSPRVAWLNCQRQFWRQLFDEMDHAGQNLGRGPELGVESETLAAIREISPRLGPALRQVASIAASFVDLCNMAMKSGQAGKLLLLNCERLQTLLDNEPLLGSLAGFWRELRQSHATSLDAFLPAAAAFGQACGRLAASLSPK